MQHLAWLNNRGARPVPALDCSVLENSPFARRPMTSRPPEPIFKLCFPGSSADPAGFGEGHETLLASFGRHLAARLRRPHGKSANAPGARHAAAFMARYSARRGRPPSRLTKLLLPLPSPVRNLDVPDFALALCGEIGKPLRDGRDTFERIATTTVCRQVFSLQLMCEMGIMRWGA